MRDRCFPARWTPHSSAKLSARLRRGLLISLAFALAALSPAARAYEPVHAYDPARDATQDIEEAVAETKRTGRNVLLEGGGEWYIRRRLDEFFASCREIKELLDRNFILVKLNFSEEINNEETLAKYPRIPNCPSLLRDGWRGQADSLSRRR